MNNLFYLAFNTVFFLRFFFSHSNIPNSLLRAHIYEHGKKLKRFCFIIYDNTLQAKGNTQKNKTFKRSLFPQPKGKKGKIKW